MSRINTNVNSLISQRILGNQNKSLNQSLERLSTGLRINRGADDPAGLIASERLRSEKSAIAAAIGNAERADQVVNIAEGGLQEVNALLLEVQSLVGQSANDAGLSQEEKQANQLQVDSILQTIDRISQATSFQGIKLLNGTYDFTIDNQDENVQAFSINAAKLESGDTRDVQVVVTQSAQHGALYMGMGGAALDLSAATATFVFEVQGREGSRQFTFASGTTMTDIATGINTFKSVTGVSAAAGASGIDLRSVGFGSNEFVSVKIVDDAGQAGSVYQMLATDENTAAASGTAYSAATNPIRDEGQDVGAIINGITATSDGLVARVNTDFLDVELVLSGDGAATTPDSFTAFTITGGGAKFNLGPSVNITNQVSVGIGNVASRNLGRFDNNEGSVYHLSDLASGKNLNVVNGNLEHAQRVVDNAIGQISAQRGRLGAFQKNVVGATIRSLGVALENTSAAESSIRDTNFASETAEMTRSQILVQAATNVLSISNSQPQNVLSLLG